MIQNAAYWCHSSGFFLLPMPSYANISNLNPMVLPGHQLVDICPGALSPVKGRRGAARARGVEPWRFKGRGRVKTISGKPKPIVWSLDMFFQELVIQLKDTTSSYSIYCACVLAIAAPREAIRMMLASAVEEAQQLQKSSAKAPCLTVTIPIGPNR